MPFIIKNRLNGMGALIASAALMIAISLSCTSFTPTPLVATLSHQSLQYFNMVSAKDVSSSNGESTIRLTKCSGEDNDVHSVASFMLDAFWLQSPQQLVLDEQTVTDSTRSILLTEQARDLMEKYGERLGKRLLDSCLLTAVDGDDDLVGVVGLEVCLFNKATNEVIGANKAETMLKNVVASLGPKQRRQYKDASVQELATELLPPEIQSICCLSNLCVSPNTRKRGIANTLCLGAEETAFEWGYNEIFLKVERENSAARYLYENKLGYEQECVLEGEVALRVDARSGFVETTADTLILKKRL